MLVVAVGLILYVGWQARYLIAGPKLSVSEGLSVVQNERVISIQGEAKNVTSLYLNGRPITIDPSGMFNEGVILENGYTIVSIDAKDRYGRSVHWEQPFVYTERTEMVSR